MVIGTLEAEMAEQVQYTEDNIRSLDWKEHIRMRPGMYIGKLGDGKDADDGIYVLLNDGPSRRAILYSEPDPLSTDE